MSPRRSGGPIDPYQYAPAAPGDELTPLSLQERVDRGTFDSRFIAWITRVIARARFWKTETAGVTCPICGRPACGKPCESTAQFGVSCHTDHRPTHVSECHASPSLVR